MTVSKVSCILGLTLLSAGTLAGCHEPNQPAPAAEHKPVEQVPAPATAAADGKPAALVAYQPESSVSELKTCNLESLDGSPFQGQKIAVSAAKPIQLAGWVFSPQMDVPQYVLRFEDKASSHYFQAPFAQAVARPDVATSLKEPAASMGFSVSLDLKNLPPANYHVYLAATDGKTLAACDNGRIVTVGP